MNVPVFEKPNEADRGQQAGGLPQFRLLNYRSGKTPELAAKRYTQETAGQYHESGDVGFSYYDKEAATNVPVKEGSFALLGSYWKLNTFTGADKNAIRYTSNMVLNIRDDRMTLYANGDKTLNEGTYRELKEAGIWGAETKIGLYWLMQDVVTGKLYSMELTNTVKNGIKVAVLKAYGKPVSKMSIDKEGLFGLADSPDNFHVFTFVGITISDAEGMPYQNKGDAYFAPIFSCGIMRREVQPELVEQALAARHSFFDKLVKKSINERVEAFQKGLPVQSATPDLPSVSLPNGWSFEGTVQPPDKDPFSAGGGEDLPF